MGLIGDLIFRSSHGPLVARWPGLRAKIMSKRSPTQALNPKGLGFRGLRTLGGTPNRDPCSLWGSIWGLPWDLGLI